MTERQVLRRLYQLEVESAALRELLAARRRLKLIRCVYCEAATRVSNLTLVQTHWYQHPHGCTGGDCWRRGERAYDCPKCGRRNYSGPETSRFYNPKIDQLADYFGARRDSPFLHYDSPQR